MLDEIDPNTDGFYVMRKILEDLNDKMGEVIDHVNKLEGVGLSEELDARMEDIATARRLLGDGKRTEAEKEALTRFVNPGESVLTISAGNVEKASEQLTDYDVIMLKRIDAETADFAPLAATIITSAKKRVIIGVHESLMDQWNLYMARVAYHWEQYQFMDSEDGIEYFIIDKLEGQTLANPSKTWFD